MPDYGLDKRHNNADVTKEKEKTNDPASKAILRKLESVSPRQRFRDSWGVLHTEAHSQPDMQVIWSV